MKNKFLAGVMSATLMVSLSTVNFKVSYAEEPTTTVSENSSGTSKSTSQELTKEQVIEDIDFVLDVIKQNHASAVEKIPDEVLKQKEVEISKLPEKVSVVEEWRTISSIVSKLHDAHTALRIPTSLWNRLPFDTETTNSQFFCTTEEFKGYQITAINGTSIEDLYKEFKLHFSHEIDEWTQHFFFEAPLNFIPDCRLALAGINTFAPIDVTFRKGEEIINHKFDLIPIAPSSLPDEPWVSYEIDKKNGIATFTLNECNCDDKYLKKLKDFFFEVNENNIKNIVVDLRRNYGGNSEVSDYFAACLKDFNYDKAKKFAEDIRNGDKLDLNVSDEENKDAINEFRKNINLFEGNVFILTSHATFSSGMWFATFFSDNDWAKIIGEIPGNSPTSFGNLTQPYLVPNSKLWFTTSFKKFYRPDSSKDPDRLIPDVQVPAKDALDEVYEIISCPEKADLGTKGDVNE